MLQKETRCIKSRGVKTFEQDEDFQLFSFVEIYIFFHLLLPFWKQQKILACFPEDKLSTIYLDLQIQKFSPPALNASCVLLEHQWMFEPFLIVVFESINCPQCEKMDLKIIQSLLERVKICKNAGKLQNLQNVEDLSEEQSSVQLFRTNKGLKNNQHKTKEQSWC